MFALWIVGSNDNWQIRGKLKEVNISYSFSKLYLKTFGNPFKLCLKEYGDLSCLKIFPFLDNRSYWLDLIVTSLSSTP
jgi:hypothetical protein